MKRFIRKHIWDSRLSGWRYQPIIVALIGKLLCRLGRHSWIIVSSRDGKYQTCGVCGKVIKNERV